MENEQSARTPWSTNDYWRLAVFFFPAAILSWGIHEYAHWLMGRALGYDMWISFNQVGLVEGSYASDWHQILVAMAGPIATWLIAIATLLLISRMKKRWLYALLFLAFWSRALAMVISFMSNPNDEAGVSLLLGMPMWIVPTISVTFMLILTYLGSRELNVGWKGNVISYLMASVVTAIIVFSDQLLF